MTTIWGDSPGFGGGHSETALMNPGIWGDPSGPPPNQSWTSSIPNPQNGNHPGAAATFPATGGGYHSGGPKNPWDPPPPTQSAGGGGWPIGSGSSTPQGGQNPSGWGAPSTGWGVPPPTQQNWAYSNQSGASPNGPSYSEAARKNVPAQPPPQQQQPPPQTIRPNRPENSEPVGWGGGKVNQGVPWDVGANQENKQSDSQWRSDGTGHWGDPSAGTGSAGGNNWGNNSNSGPTNGGSNANNEWRSGSNDVSASASSWSNSSAHSQSHNSSSSGWGAQNNRQGGGGGGGSNSWGEPAPPPTPSDNMWVPPGPQGNQWVMNGGGGYSHSYASRPETNNDMVWHDPNPKQKKVLVDKGTGAWGDPQTQVEIRRWKEAEATDATSGGNGNGSVWDKSPVAPQPTSTAASQPTSGAKTSVTTSAWGDAAPAGVNRSQSDWNIGSGGTDGWGNVGHKTSTGAMSGSEGTASDEVFANSNPLTPVTPGVNKPTSNGPAPPIPAALQALAQNPDLRDLTQQIADQLRVAVSKGLININILNQPLPQNVLLLLNQLLQRVPRLEQAQKELLGLQNSGGGNSLNGTQQQESIRLNQEIQKLQSEIQRYQQQINHQTSSQWQKPSPQEGEKGKLNQSSSAANLDSLDNNLASLGLSGSDHPWGKMNTTGVDWTLSRDNDSNGSGKCNGETEKSPLKSGGGGPGGNSGTNSSSTTPIPNLAEGPKEFIPGKRWDWKDPREMADDPNATPGSMKPNPLSVGNLTNFTGGSGQGGFGLPGNITPTKMNFDMRPPATMSPNMSDVWGTRQRPPSFMGQGFQGPPARIGYRSMSSPGSAFAPYAGAPSWVILGNLNQSDERILKDICSKVGRMVTYSSPPNGVFAAVRFAESVVERILPRLQAELAPLGVSVQMAKDQEVERLLSAMSGRPAGMGGGGVPMWGEPPQSAGPWGAPPFAPGGMMPDMFHHTGFGSDGFRPPGIDPNSGF